ncbi:hypothetical protein NE237_016708 [Protea cynaroides]|uniref:Uncharacterized protein n=1 Tax=Protea cynaroides TaxID=273540 RepID=A0A9Q0HFB1_9MAGN|nr:hypothetical protein NE237_016708 [Protea cynaroides]
MQNLTWNMTLQFQNPNPDDRHHQTPANRYINLFGTGNSTSASSYYVTGEGGGVQVTQWMGQGKAPPISEASGANLAAAQLPAGLVLADGCIQGASKGATRANVKIAGRVSGGAGG